MTNLCDICGNPWNFGLFLNKFITGKCSGSFYSINHFRNREMDLNRLTIKNLWIIWNRNTSGMVVGLVGGPCITVVYGSHYS